MQRSAGSMLGAGLTLLLLVASLAAPARGQDVGPEPRPRLFSVGSSNNFPPINYLDENYQLTGFGRDLSTAVIEAVGGRTQYFHSARYQDVLEGLARGELDFIHDTAYSAAREAQLDFSEPILSMPEVIVVRPGKWKPESVEDLFGRKVACVNQHVSHLYLKSFPQIHCVTVQQPIEAMLALFSQDVDAVVYPRQIIEYLARRYGLASRIQVSDVPLRELNWHMVVRDGDRAMLQLLNRGIARVRASGQYQAIYEKYFGPTPRLAYSFGDVALYASGTAGLAILLVSLLYQYLYIRRLRVQHRREAQLRADLEESEANYRTLFESSLVGITVIQGGRYVLVNDTFAQWLGYQDRADFFRRTDGALLRHTEPQHHQSSLQLISDLEAGRGRRGEMVRTAVRLDGSILDIRLIRTRIQWKGRPAVLSMVLDETERLAAEKALRASEARYRSLVENSLQGILVHRDHHPIFANDALAHIFGYENAEEILRLPSTYALIAEEEYERLAAFNAARNQGEPVPLHYDFRGVRKDGTKIWIETITRRIPWDGEMATLSVRYDITDRRNAEDSLKDAYRDLGRAQEQMVATSKLIAMGELAGGIAHEINNPLAVIASSAELLSEHTLEASPQVRRHLDKITDTVYRCKATIQSLLSFARRDFDEIGRVDLPQLITETLGLVSNMRQARERVLRFEGGGTFADTDGIGENQSYGVRIPAQQLQQVLINLLTNAVQATDAGGQVVVRLERAEGGVRITVADTGAGIPEAQLEQIFEPFFTTKPRGQGSGLGLFLCRQIVQFFKGRIEVRSTVGVGTVFTVWLPTETEPLHAQIAPAGEAGLN